MCVCVFVYVCWYVSECAYLNSAEYAKPESRLTHDRFGHGVCVCVCCPVEASLFLVLTVTNSFCLVDE